MRQGATIVGLWAVLLAAGTARAQMQPSFRTSLGDQLFNTAKSFVVDDLDGDGNADLIIAVRGEGGGSGGVSILLGQGDGNFFDGRCLPSCDIPTDSVPSALAVANFNGDDHKDIATVDPNSLEVRVLLGTEFPDSFDGPAVTLPKTCTGTDTQCNFDDDCVSPATCDLHGVTSPSNLVAADFDGDQKMDLAVVSDDLAGEVAVLLGNGDGTFKGTTQSPLGAGSTTRAVKAFDLNNDQKLDLITANRDSGSISVLLNLGGGNFSMATAFPAGESPLDLVVGNFTADTKPDVVVANYNTDSFSLLRGDGNGGFAAPTSFPAGVFPDAISSADFDLDGRLDVVVSNNLSNDVTVGFGNGAGGFPRIRSFVAGLGPLDVVAAKIDSDDRPDIVALNSVDGSSYNVMLGLPERAFASAETFPIVENAGPVGTGDINSDGLPDAMITSSSATALTVLHPTLDDSFNVGSLELGDFTRAILLADLNRDGHPELLVAGGAEAGFVGLAQPLAGSFGPLVKTVVGGSPSGIDVADFNNDGRLDVAVSERSDDTVSVLFSQPDGSLGTRPNSGCNAGGCKIQLRPVGDPDALQPQAVAAGDVDGDGNADLVVTGYRENGTLSIVYGKGDGTFQSAVLLDGGRRPQQVRIADVDNDGLEDIVTANEDSKGIVIHRALPPATSRTYETKIEISVGGQAMDFVLRDVTGDGILDIVIADFTDERVPIKPGGRSNKPYFNGTVEDCPHPGCLETGRNPSRIGAGDFNGDGTYDLVSVNAFQAKNASLVLSDLESTVLRGDGNGDGHVTAADLITITGLVPAFNRLPVEELRRQGKVDTLALDADGDGLLSSVDTTGTAAHIFH